MNLAEALCNKALLMSHFSHAFYVLLFIMVVGDSSSLSLTLSKKIKTLAGVCQNPARTSQCWRDDACILACTLARHGARQCHGGWRL